MLRSMEVTMIQQLAERGLSVSAIARHVGADRKTVRKALHEEGREKGPRKARPSMLDPHKEWLLAQLQAADFTAQRLFQDLRARGYAGSYNLVKRFVAPLREEERRRAVVRFETMPGQQAQVDWASGFGVLPIDGVPKRLSCFSMVLGYSRYQYIEFTCSQNLVVFLACHLHAFEYFQGAPSEVLYDNLKTAVLAHVGGVVEYEPRLLDFAGCYGFTPKACRPYRAQTKGKVERPFPYIRSNFFLGRSFRDLADLNVQALSWLDTVAHARLHGTTQERPKDRFERERPHLRRLPARPFPLVERVFRSSTRDSLISYGGNFYSVPHRHAGRRGLAVEVAQGELKVYHHKELIARHGLACGKRRRIIDPQHFQGLMPERCRTPTERRLAELQNLGPDAQGFLQGLVKTQTRFLPWHIGRLEELLWKNGPQVLLKALARSSRFEAYDARTVANLCRQMRPLQEEPTRLGSLLTDVLDRAQRQGDVELRPLSDYDRLCPTTKET